MAGEAQDIDSLKPDDVVITSTPQQRKEQEKEKEEEVPKPADSPDPEKKEEPKKGEEEGKEGEEESKEGEEEPKESGEGEEPSDEFDWEALSQDVGIDLASDDEMVEALKELAGYRALSPALQKAIEIERNKGDVALFFKSLANDPKDLSDRDALWEQYVLDNPKRVAVNPKFARMDFDRKLDKEYKLLTDYEKLKGSEQEEFLEEHKADLEYLREKRKFDAEAARASLQENRDKMEFYPSKPAMDEKKAQEVIRNHEAGYKKALSEFDVISLKVDKDFEFNVGMTDSNRKIASEWLRNPEALLAELGFSKDKIDYDTLAGWAALIADIKYGTFGDRFRRAILDSKDIKTLESTLDAPGMVKTGEKPPLQVDEWEAVGEAFEKKRLEAKKKR